MQIHWKTKTQVFSKCFRKILIIHYLKNNPGCCFLLKRLNGLSSPEIFYKIWQFKLSFGKIIFVEKFMWSQTKSNWNDLIYVNGGKYLVKRYDCPYSFWQRIWLKNLAISQENTAAKVAFEMKLKNVLGILRSPL